MILVEVVSSNVKKIGYENGKLYVLYSGGLYEYDGVTKEIYEELLASESKGKYISQNIKGRYNYKKVESCVR